MSSSIDSTPASSMSSTPPSSDDAPAATSENGRVANADAALFAGIGSGATVMVFSCMILSCQLHRNRRGARHSPKPPLRRSRAGSRARKSSHDHTLTTKESPVYQHLSLASNTYDMMSPRQPTASPMTAGYAGHSSLVSDSSSPSSSDAPTRSIYQVPALKPVSPRRNNTGSSTNYEGMPSADEWAIGTIRAAKEDK